MTAALQLPMFLKDDFMKALKAGEKLDCPCCGRHAQIYRRTLHKGIACALIRMYRLAPDKSYLHISDFCSVETGMDVPIARHWGLIEAKENMDDAKQTSGYWRLTQQGIYFVQNELTIPKYVSLYDNQELGFHGEHVTITQCLGNKFNYTELMEA